MSDILGYLSSLFVTLGMGFGFLVGGLIFALLIIYAVMLLFGRTRRIMKEDRATFYSPHLNHLDRLNPARQIHRRNPAGRQRE